MKVNGLTNRIAVKTDLQTELQPLQSLIEIYGKERVLIENHRGVCEYDKSKIVVLGKSGKIGVCGAGLRIALMTKCRLVIQGKIHDVCLCEEG